MRRLLSTPAVWFLLLTARALPGPLIRLFCLCASHLAARLPSRANTLIDRHRRNILRPAGLDVEPSAVYRNMLLSLFDFIRLSGSDDAAFLESVEVTGAENLDKALESCRGAICITAHYGAWELIPRSVILMGHRTAIVGRKLSDSGAGRRLDRLRTMHGVAALDRASDVRRLVGMLRGNTAVGILIDQDTTAVESEFVDFFGIPALTPVGPARLAVRFRIPLVPLHIARRQDGSHLLVIEKPLDTGDFPGEDGYIRLTARLNSIIEGWIRADPSQWIWFHERWCRRPPGCPGLR